MSPHAHLSIGLAVGTSHNLIILSKLPEANDLPSGPNAAAVTFSLVFSVAGECPGEHLLLPNSDQLRFRSGARMTRERVPCPAS